MSRELWVVEKTYCDEVIGSYRYKVEPREITKYPEHIRVTRYVTADSLQPEWWCEPRTVCGVMDYVVCCRLNSMQAEIVLTDTAVNSSEDAGDLCGLLRSACHVLVVELTKKLWGGGL